jgi:molybdopterin-guanine dinucleotide biosynthesis protein A
MNGVSALILAGGRSVRFGADKTTAAWQGQTLIARAVAQAGTVSDDVIVLSAWSRHEGEGSPIAGARELHDPEPFPGPLVALATGLVHVRHDLCLVLAADMPTVNPKVVQLMLARAVADPALNAIALERDGTPQPLPVLIRARSAYPYLARIVASGERRLRAVLDMPATCVIDERSWQRADRDRDSLRDIDTPADYQQLLSRKPGPTATAA